MKKVIITMLVVLFMGCNLENDSFNSNLQGSWYNVEDDTFTNYVFADEFSISKTNNGIRGTVVYDYYADDNFIYILLNADYEKAYEIVDISDSELSIVSIPNNEMLIFKRD